MYKTKNYFTVHENSKILLDLGHACYPYEPKKQTDLPLFLITSEGKTRRIRHNNNAARYFVVMDTAREYFDTDHTLMINFIMYSCLQKSPVTGKDTAYAYFAPSSVTRHLLEKHFSVRDLDILRAKADANKRRTEGGASQEEKDLAALEKTEQAVKNDIASKYHIPESRIFPKLHSEYKDSSQSCDDFVKKWGRLPQSPKELRDFCVTRYEAEKARNQADKIARFGQMYGGTAEALSIGIQAGKTAVSFKQFEERVKSQMDAKIREGLFVKPQTFIDEAAKLQAEANKNLKQQLRLIEKLLKPSIKQRILNFLGFVDVKVSVTVPDKKDMKRTIIEGVKIE